MKEEIINNLDNPRQLEKLYRDNKETFKREFNLTFPDIQESPTALANRTYGTFGFARNTSRPFAIAKEPFFQLK